MLVLAREYVKSYACVSSYLMYMHVSVFCLPVGYSICVYCLCSACMRSCVFICALAVRVFLCVGVYSLFTLDSRCLIYALNMQVCYKRNATI